jgi:hypothetical protein
VRDSDPTSGRRRSGGARRSVGAARPARSAGRRRTARTRRRPDAARVAQWARVIWLVLIAASVGGLLVTRVLDDAPELVRQLSAGALTTLLAWGLAVRAGGRAWWAVVLAGSLSTLAFATGWEPLLAGGAVGTAVLAGTLAVLATQPAATFRLAIREALVATLVAAVGAVGVVGFVPDAGGPGAALAVGRFRYVVLALALLGAMGLVYRLGAGFHGLGRRGYVLAGVAVLVLAVTLAYSEALARWGAPELIGFFDGLRDGFREHLHAVPHPIAALLGYPALVWGVFTRARRRQGWWVCAFGVAATATAATRLVDQATPVGTVLLSGLYSIVVGLALGYLVIRTEQALTGTHGRRARRHEEAAAHRPEPGRMHALH